MFLPVGKAFSLYFLCLTLLGALFSSEFVLFCLVVFCLYSTSILCLFPQGMQCLCSCLLFLCVFRVRYGKSCWTLDHWHFGNCSCSLCFRFLLDVITEVCVVNLASLCCFIFFVYFDGLCWVQLMYRMENNFGWRLFCNFCELMLLFYFFMYFCSYYGYQS